MFVKDRTGRTRTVDAGYVLRDGESISVAMTTFDAAPLAPPVVIVTGDHSPLATAARRNGPPVTIKDDTMRSPEFAAGAAFASQELYERRIGDAWRESDTDGER